MRTIRKGTMAIAIAATIGLPGSTWAADHDDADSEPELDVAQLFFELNHTDGDLGLQMLLDNKGWVKAQIDGHNDNLLLQVAVFGRLGRQGLTELFFESAEPNFDDFPPEKFFTRFPEGTYDIEVETRRGKEFESEVELSHVIPAPAGNITVGGAPAAADCDAELPIGGTADVLIQWDPVTTSHPDLGKSGPVAIDNYEFVVEIEDEENDRVHTMNIKLPPSVTEFLIPASFTALAPEGEVKFEVGGQAAQSYNRTVVESCFLTEAEAP